MMQKIYDALNQLRIPYQEHRHPAVSTSAEAAQYYDTIPGAHVKNLFLRNRSGKQHYLVVVLDHKTIDLKQLAKKLGESQLGFASPERLMTYLQVTPGSVSALGLIHDGTKHVRVVLDSAINEYAEISLHPNDNTKTITLAVSEFERLLTTLGHQVQRLPL